MENIKGVSPAIDIHRHFIPKEHIDLVKSLGLSQEDEAKILWKTAIELLRLEVTE